MLNSLIFFKVEFLNFKNLLPFHLAHYPYDRLQVAFTASSPSRLSADRSAERSHFPDVPVYALFPLTPSDFPKISVISIPCTDKALWFNKWLHSAIFMLQSIK